MQNGSFLVVCFVVMLNTSVRWRAQMNNQDGKEGSDWEGQNRGNLGENFLIIFCGKLIIIMKKRTNHEGLLKKKHQIQITFPITRRLGPRDPGLPPWARRLPAKDNRVEWMQLREKRPELPVRAHRKELLTRFAVALHVRGPQGQVVPQQLHDERGILVRLLRQRVQLGDRVVERRLR